MVRGEGAGVQVGAERVGSGERPGEGQTRRMGLCARLLPLAPLRPTVLEPDLQSGKRPGSARLRPTPHPAPASSPRAAGPASFPLRPAPTSPVSGLRLFKDTSGAKGAVKEGPT